MGSGAKPRISVVQINVWLSVSLSSRRVVEASEARKISPAFSITIFELLARLLVLGIFLGDDV